MRLSILGLEKVMDNKKSKKADKRKKDKIYRSQVIISYTEGVSETADRVLKKYRLATAMSPHTTLRCLLVYPKDKVEPEVQGKLVYQILCKSCGAAYMGRQRLFKTRLEEHEKYVENAPREQYTRSI